MITVQKISKEIEKRLFRFIRWTEETYHWKLACDGDLESLHNLAHIVGLDREKDYFPFNPGYPCYIVEPEKRLAIASAIESGAEYTTIQEQEYLWNNRFNNNGEE